MQKLYEQHKVLTYPRTDSRYISSDIVGTLPERLKACGVGEYRPFAHKVLQKPIKPNKSFVDDSKVFIIMRLFQQKDTLTSRHSQIKNAKFMI